jgi:hypothetical protein
MFRTPPKLQQALFQSYGSQYDHLKRISTYTMGIIFAGTPHRGAPHASYAKVLASMVQLMAVSVNKEILNVLERESELLVRINQSFANFLANRKGRGLPETEITCFAEELETGKFGLVSYSPT